MRKLSLLVLISLIFTLTACQSTQVNEDPIDENNELIELTLEELSYYDGKEGRPAYIAVNGDIYDVSDSSFWQMGLHNGYGAGQDLTDPIMNNSPHGIANLSRVPLIGKIVEED